MTTPNTLNSQITLDLPMFKNMHGKITQAMIDAANKDPTLVSALNRYNDSVVSQGIIDPSTGQT